MIHSSTAVNMILKRFAKLIMDTGNQKEARLVVDIVRSVGDFSPDRLSHFGKQASLSHLDLDIT